MASLSEEGDRSWTGDVDLLGVVTREYEDSVGVSVVGKTEDSRLDRGELRAGTNKEGALGTARERIPRRKLTRPPAICCRGITQT